jgi:excisionase family DNA binding protein
MSKELLTVEEAAELLRTSKKAIYTKVEQGSLPGVVRDGRRLLFNRAVLRRHLGLTTVPPPSYSKRLSLESDAGSERTP